MDSSRQIADRCGNAKGGSLVATGRGGMPQGPMKKHSSDRPWNDLRSMSVSNPTTVPPIVTENPVKPIVEATAIEWMKLEPSPSSLRNPSSPIQRSVLSRC